MRRTKMVFAAAAVMAALLVAFAAPAMARSIHNKGFNNRFNNCNSFNNCNGFNNCNDFNGFNNCNDFNNGFNHPFDNGFNNGVSQSNEQNVESGDSSQTFNVTGGGDNSNACQGIQGISNTGNSVNSTNVLQYASLGDIGVSDSGNFTISPSQSTTCKQAVNQAASASG